MEESSIAYNMPAALRLDGPVAAEALAAAFDAVVGRHESLRTRFVEIDGEPRQIVSPIPLGRAEFADVSDFDDSEAEARRLANEDAATAFDLAQGPLVRMKLIRLGEESHALLFNMHHIISDEWSLRIFIREFMDAYGDVAAGRAFSRDSLKIQYRDFAAWQSALLASKDAEAHRDYWRGRFAEEAPILDLPLDFARPPLKTYCGRSLSFSIDRALTSGLEAFARARGASLYMALVAAVKVLLHRYTQQTDIVVGMPIAGRNRLDLEDQIGFYINALPLRSTLDSEAPFERTLAEISRNALGAYEHQIYPFDRLVDDLQIRRDVSRHPLFDVVVVMQNAGGDEFSLPGAAVTPLVDDYDVSKFDLQFSFEERGGEIAAAITWNTDLFVEERIVRMSRHFLELVRSLLRDPTEVISRLNILTDDERRAAASWVPAHVEPCGPETIAARFEAHAAADPNAPAVVFEDSEEAMPRITMTYGELNAAANRLAHRLRSLGVGPDGLVAVHLERSPRMVVALLGVLKAGGAYLPIDTAYPKDRVRFMLEDSGCRVLLTERGVLGDSSHLTEGVAVLTLDDADLGSESAENPEFLAGPEHLAYVIYTSGSTGLPKGCLVTNRNVTRLFDATDPWFGFNAQDAWSLFHSCAFDFSVWEIWGALLYGGRLVIIPYWVSRSPEAFHELMLREGVTVLNQTPSAFRQLIPIAVKAGRGDLRAVIFGGEALDIPGLRPWFEAFGDETPRLVNMYGITETTVHVTYRPITMKDCERPASVVGTPIPDLGIRIVDRHLEPVPTGIPGEILVGGAGVARGYLNRPELTSERFVRSAVVDGNASPRVEYRSGDLARRLFDGDIEYLGRIDHQVKIRGFRIELGEIEAALSRCDGVRGASVHHQKRPEGDRLVAWVEAAATVDPANLRESLRKRLPEYMIPAVIMPVDKFSLTANGKIDRRALPDPDAYASGAAASGGEAFAAPASGAEARIATVMQEILAVPRVSASANWFDLGAQSILLVRAHAKLQNAFGRKFPLLWLYQYPTIAALAAQLERGDGPDTKAAADSRAAAQDAEDRAAKQRESRAARRRPGGGDR
jgi:amino acid adenylation domain-containing protein